MRQKRVKLKLNDSDYYLLRAMAADRGLSVERALEMAVEFAQFVERLRLEGGRLIVERPDGSFHEIVGPTGGLYHESASPVAEDELDTVIDAVLVEEPADTLRPSSA
jgi:hypothetical protein